VGLSSRNYNPALRARRILMPRLGFEPPAFLTNSNKDDNIQALFDIWISLPFVDAHGVQSWGPFGKSSPFNFGVRPTLGRKTREHKVEVESEASFFTL
jgi:hypothetical protein